MQKDRVWYVALHLLNAHYVVRIVQSPALHLLILGQRIHDGADEVAPGAAFVQDVRRQGCGVESVSPKALAPHPGREDLFAVRAAYHGAKARNQLLVKRQITPMDGKPARGQ